MELSHSTPPFEPLHKLSHTRAVMLSRGTLRIPKHFLCWCMLNLQAHQLLLQKNDEGPVGMQNSDRTEKVARDVYLALEHFSLLTVGCF